MQKNVFGIVILFTAQAAHDAFLCSLKTMWLFLVICSFFFQP